MADPRDSISAENKYMFLCPVTQREVNYGACLRTLQDHKQGNYTGERECHACMAACKCPAEYMWVLEFKEKQSRFFSKEEKLGKVPTDVVARIAPVLIGESTCERFAVPVDRRAVIGATETGDRGWVYKYGEPAFKSVPVGQVEKTQRRRDTRVEKPAERQERPVRREPTPTPAVAPKKELFSNGDYSDVINKMIEEESKPKASASTTPSKGMSLLDIARMKKKEKMNERN